MEIYLNLDPNNEDDLYIIEGIKKYSTTAEDRSNFFKNALLLYISTSEDIVINEEDLEIPPYIPEETTIDLASYNKDIEDTIVDLHSKLLEHLEEKIYNILDSRIGGYDL